MSISRMAFSWTAAPALLLVATFAGCDSADRTASEGQPAAAETASRPAADRRTETTDRQPAESSAPVIRSLSVARAELERGNPAQAYALAKSYLISKPDDSDALMLAARCLFAMQQPDQGVAMLAEIPADDPAHGMEAIGQVADWYMGNGQPEKAEAAFRSLIAAHGDVPLAHSRLALLMNAQGRRYDAKPHLMALAKAEDITRQELEALVVIGDQCATTKVPGTTGEGGKLVPGDLRVVRQHSLTGDFDRCLRLGERLWDAYPDSAPIAAFMGKAYMDVQRFDRLQSWSERLPEGTRRYPLYWSTMARWMAAIGRPADAVYCASVAVRMDPTDHVAYETLASALQIEGDLDNARSAQQRATKLRELRKQFWATADTKPSADQLIAIAESMLDLHRPHESIGWLRQSHQLNPSNPRIAALAERLRTYRPPADYVRWIVCGLDVDRLVEPDLSIAAAESRERLGAPEAGDSETAGGTIEMVDVAADVGLEFKYDSGNRRTDGSYLLLQTMGGGIGVLDYDRDGWPDAYFSQGGGTAYAEDNAPNRLFRNLNGERFDEIATNAGVVDSRYGQGVSAADFNQDGFVDLVVANIGRNTLYRNNGDGTFVEVELPSWHDKDHWTSQVAVADLTGDGLVDLVECNYIDDPTAMTTYCTPSEQLCAPAKFRPATNRVLVGVRDGAFRPDPGAAEMESLPRFSLGVVVGNLDDRAGNDLFVANDTVENELWINSDAAPLTPEGDSPKLRMTEQSRLRGCATGSLGELQGCMGIAVGDFDHNGTFDMYVTNYFNQPSNLYMQQSGGLFVDHVRAYSAFRSSVPKVGFGTQAADLDQDGWLDLVVLNGHAVDRRELGEPLEMPPQLYRGRPRKLVLTDQADPFWQTATLGRTLAIWDWNRDGRVDFLANHLDVPATLLENRSRSGNSVRFELVGTRSERDATGSKVSLRCGEQTWVSWVTSGDGYFSTNEAAVHLGTGRAETIDTLRIDWPSGATQTFENVDCNARYLLIEGAAKPFRQSLP